MGEPVLIQEEFGYLWCSSGHRQCWSDEIGQGGELAFVRIDFRAVIDNVNHGGPVFKLQEARVGGMILKICFEKKFPVDGNMVYVVLVLMSYLVSSRVVFLVLCCFYSRLLTFQGYSRIYLLVMLTTLLCFVEFHILVIGHLWQHHWMMIWLWTVIGPVGGRIQAREGCRCQARQGGCLFLVLVLVLSYLSPPLSSDLVIDGSVVEMVSEWKILGIIPDSKLAFEKQVRAIAASASRRVGILRKTMSIFRDLAVLAKYFWAFILSVLEYCSSVLCRLPLLTYCCLIGLLAELAS